MDYKAFCVDVLGSKFLSVDELNEAFDEMGDTVLTESAIDKNPQSFKLVSPVSTIGEVRKLIKKMADYTTAYTNDGLYAIRKMGRSEQFMVACTDRFYKSGKTSIGYFYAIIPHGIQEVSDDTDLKTAISMQKLNHFSNVSEYAFNPMNLHNVPTFKRKLRVGDNISLEHFFGVLAHKNYVSLQFDYDYTKDNSESYSYSNTNRDWLKAIYLCVGRLGLNYPSNISVIGFTIRNEPILQFQVDRNTMIEFVLSEEYNINSKTGYSPTCPSAFSYQFKNGDIFVNESGKFARILGFIGKSTIVVETLKAMEFYRYDGQSEFKPSDTANSLPYTVRVKTENGKPTINISGDKFVYSGVPANQVSIIAQSTSR